MKHIKLCLMALLGLLLLPQISRAQGAATTASGSTVGKISAYIVTGDVELTPKDGTPHKLARGEQFEEGAFIKAMPGGNALLVFSNGTTMKITENTQMAVTQYKQNSYDEKTEGTFLRLNKDPSKSTTQLDLRNGTLQGEVKQINTTAGSKFVVDTPAGSAGIRGTILSITVIRDPQGHVTGIIANCMVGNVSFTPSAVVTVTNTNGQVIKGANGNPDVGITTGGQMQVTLTVDPVTGQVNGGGVTGGNLGANATNDLIAALNDTVNAAKTLTGQDIAPPQTVVPGSVTTTIDLGGGNTQTITTSTNTITVLPPTANVPTISTSNTSTIVAGTISITTTSTTGTPVNTNPSNVTADGTK